MKFNGFMLIFGVVFYVLTDIVNPTDYIGRILNSTQKGIFIIMICQDVFNLMHERRFEHKNLKRYTKIKIYKLKKELRKKLKERK